MRELRAAVVCVCVCVCVCDSLCGPVQVELPADLFEFHEVISHMQEVEEAVVDGHRDFYDVRPDIISPPGIAMPPAALSYRCYFLFLMSSLGCHSTTGGRITTRIVALTPSMKNYYDFKFVELCSSNPGSFAWVVSARRLKYAVRWFLKVIR